MTEPIITEARAIHRIIDGCDTCAASEDPRICADGEYIARALAQARAEGVKEGRLAGMEEAAEIVAEGAFDLAAAIRARATKEG